MSNNRSRSGSKRGSTADHKCRRLEKECNKLKADLRKLQQKDDVKGARIAAREKQLKRDQDQLEKQRGVLKKAQNKLKQEKKQFHTSRKVHHDDAHDTDQRTRLLGMEEQRLKNKEHKLELEARRVEHLKTQVEQKKLSLAHNAEFHTHNQKTITQLNEKLKVAEERLEEYERTGNVSNTKLIRKLREYPEWVKKEGWNYRRGKQRMENIIRDSCGKTQETNDSPDNVDLTLKYQEQMRMNFLLNEELEKVHADYQHLQKGLSVNMVELEKNEDLLVVHVHEILRAYEESSVQHLCEKNPNTETKGLVSVSNNQIRELMAAVDEKVSKGYSDTRVEGTDASLLNQVHMKAEIKLLLEELLLKIGRLSIGMNQQISQNLSNPGGGGKVMVAVSEVGDTEAKLFALRKKHEELQQHSSIQEDALKLLKQQCIEQSKRHAQIHSELETVLKFFLRARGKVNYRCPKPCCARDAKSELTVEKLYKGPSLMPPFVIDVGDAEH